jgi:hypothetical protein
MGVELEDTDGLAVAFEDISREEAMEAANRAFSWSQENLYAAGDSREYDVDSVAQLAQPPQWDESAGAARFTYDHPAAPFFEYGTQTHEIVADGATLAFEWPDAPQEVQEMFESTFPTVFFQSVKVEGIDALSFLRGAMADTERWLKGRE